MLDFWAKGADGVTVRRVTLFVVVFRMAGGLPSRALVATGELDRNVFIVAVVASAGGASLGRRGCRRVSLAWSARWRSGGASLWEGAADSSARGSRVSGLEGGAPSPSWAAGGFLKPQAAAIRAV